MADYNSAYTGAEIDQGVGNGLAAPTTYAPKAHDDANTTYGKGTDTKYGHLKLSASTSSTSGTSGGIAATPSAVKAAYDLANGKQSPATTLAGYGITDAATSADLGTFVRPNLLDNWYFVGGGSQQGGGQFPINQRGKTSYTSTDVYSVDRWGVGNYITVAVNSGYLTISNTDSSNRHNFSQPIENPSKLYGKKLCGSILLSNGSLYSGTVTVPSSPPESTQYLNLANFGSNSSFRITASTTGTIVADIMVGGNESIQVAVLKLEIGATQTLAHQEGSTWVLNEIPHFEQELVKCQRYFLPLYNIPANKNGAHSVGYAYSATSASVFVSTPVEMRAKPSITVTETGSLKQNGSLVTSSPNISVDTWLPNGVKMNIDASDMAVNQPVDWCNYKAVLSADL